MDVSRISVQTVQGASAVAVLLFDSLKQTALFDQASRAKHQCYLACLGISIRGSPKVGSGYFSLSNLWSSSFENRMIWTSALVITDHFVKKGRQPGTTAMTLIGRDK